MRINTEKIVVMLVKNQMNRKNLADKAGMSAASISTILNRGTCTTANLAKIAKALETDAGELIIKN